MTRRVDGPLMKKMLTNSLAFLRRSEERINGLNVFPVADGDTGSNMRLTLENGLQAAGDYSELCYFLRDLSKGMLLGARGNSGVILSQIFKGFYAALNRCAAANIADLRNAFIKGYKTAYESVVSPVEGTVLTVAREGIENIRTQLDRNTSIETFFGMYLAEMQKVLPQTPEMLPVLKEYGVVDSGAVGYITIVEGMLKFLSGEVIEGQTLQTETVTKTEVSENIFNENSVFEQGYCMEFVLQLLNGENYNSRFKLSAFSDDLKLYGNSIVVSQDGSRVKTHVHTLKPGKVIALCQEFGEFISFKLENMQVQHNEFIIKHPKKDADKGDKKPLAIVAVVNGDGMKNVYKELGCDVVIDGTSRMNTSSQEFIDAFAEAWAENIIVLTNNKNVVRAAQQAASLVNDTSVHIIPTNSMVEGYYALSCDLPDEGPEKRIKAMLDGAGNIVTLAETKASRDYEHNGIGCKIGEEIALVNERLVCASDNQMDVLIGGLHKVENMDEKECAVIFRGAGIDADMESALEERIAEEYPLLELVFLEGGQQIYNWLIGLI